MINFENVSFSYPATQDEPSRQVLCDLSLTINRGEFVAVLGCNGSGKSTFARHCNALLLPEKGRVLIDGMDTMQEENHLEIRRRVGIVFQNPDNQIVANVVEEDVAFAPENLGVPPEEIRQRVDRALAAVGMEKHALRAPHLLSGGQKQRIAIAGILAMAPECIILDEATAMLDPQGRKTLLDTIERLHREQQITVLQITHHMEEAQRADRIIVLHEGRVAMDGTPREVLTQTETLDTMGLRAPDTVRLLHMLREGGMNVATDLVRVEDCVQEIVRRL